MTSAKIYPFCGAYSLESCEIDDDFDTPCIAMLRAIEARDNGEVK